MDWKAIAVTAAVVIPAQVRPPRRRPSGAGSGLSYVVASPTHGPAQIYGLVVVRHRENRDKFRAQASVLYTRRRTQPTCKSRAHISRAHSRRPQIKTVLTIELLILIYYFFLIRLASLATHGMAIFVAMIIMPSIVFFVLAIAALLATRELYGQSAIAANRRGSYRPPLCDGLQLDGSRSCLEGYSDTLTHARTGAAAVSASS